MLANTQAGLRKMYENLSNYDKYLKMVLSLKTNITINTHYIFNNKATISL